MRSARRSGLKSHPLVREVRRNPERFISYAQNLEDVMLWRALKSYTPGFYIDLGAGEPEADSVTKAFHERGWRGINVEPMPKTFERLRQARPRDINLQLAVEDTRGRRTYFSIDDQNGLSTGQKSLATRYLELGRTVSELEVEVDTLDHICRTYVSQEIHFLKVDVEGGEDAVFAGADLRANRPWILVIESPEAASPPRRPEWHQALDAAGYEYVYYDGLNRFYLAREKVELFEPAFASPPNWFDNYVTAREAQLEEAETVAREEAEMIQTLSNERDQLQNDRDQLQARIEAVSAETTELGAQVVALQRELDGCYQELFEDSRRIGWLSAQRQNLVTALGEQRSAAAAEAATVAERDATVARILNSRAWRITRPLRALTWRAKGVRGRRA
jgi:FkbM family methyltransferase